MRVELAEYVADGTRRLLELGPAAQAQLRHRVDDAPLNGLQAITDMRQGAIENHIHRVIEIRLLGELLQRAPFNVIEIEGHGRLHFVDGRRRRDRSAARSSELRKVPVAFEPTAAIGRAFFCEQQVDRLVCVVAGRYGEPDETPCLGGDCGFTKL